MQVVIIAKIHFKLHQYVPLLLGIEKIIIIYIPPPISLYVFMCVCLYVCVYVCMYVCIYVYMYICIYVYMYVCMYACMHACMYVCMYTTFLDLLAKIKCSMYVWVSVCIVKFMDRVFYAHEAVLTSTESIYHFLNHL